MADLDSILSGGSAIASEAPEPVNQPTPEVAEAPELDNQETDTPEPAEASNGSKMVPHEALHKEKEKVKRYTEQVASFEKTLAEREAAWERRIEQLVGTMKPKEPEPEAPDFWNDPDGYLKGALTPVQQQIAEQREMMSQLMAEEKFGVDTVKAALTDLESYMRSNPAAKADYQAIMQNRHPYGALVEWHKRHQTQAEIGADPEAYQAKLREDLKAEVLAELQGGNQQEQAVAPAAVMPSNLAGTRNVGTRSGPAWSGPQPLNDIFKR